MADSAILIDNNGCGLESKQDNGGPILERHSPRSYINDVIGNLFRIVKKFEYETNSYRELIILLLHYRHMVLFIRKRFDEQEWKDKFGENLVSMMDSDLDCCDLKFRSLVIRNNGDEDVKKENGGSRHNFLQFIRHKESNHYKQNSDEIQYCPLECDQDDGFSNNFRNNLYFDNLESSFNLKQYSDYNVDFDDDELEDEEEEKDLKKFFPHENYGKILDQNKKKKKKLLNKTSKQSKRKRTKKQQTNDGVSLLFSHHDSNEDDDSNNDFLTNELDHQTATKLGRYIAENYRNKKCETQNSATLFSATENECSQIISESSIENEVDDRYAIYLDGDEMSMLNLPDVSLFIETNLLESHNSKRYACKIPDCDFVTAYGDQAKGHLYRHFNLAPYRCNLCQFQTQARKQFWKHSKQTHKLSKFLYDYFDLFGLSDPLSNKNDTGVSSSVPCDTTIITTSSTSASASDLCESYCCKFPSCTYQTRQRTQLVQHLRWHLNRSPFRCRLCSKRFEKRQDGFSHWKRIHQKDYEDYQSSLGIGGSNGTRLGCPFDGCQFRLDQEDLQQMLEHIEQQHELSYKVLYGCSLFPSGGSTVPENEFKDESDDSDDHDDEEDQDFVSDNFEDDDEAEVYDQFEISDNDLDSFLPDNNNSSNNKRKSTISTKSAAKSLNKKIRKEAPKTKKKTIAKVATKKCTAKSKSKSTPSKSRSKARKCKKERLFDEAEDDDEFGLNHSEDNMDDSEPDEEFDEENLLYGSEYFCSHDNCYFTSSSMMKLKAHEYRKHVKTVLNCTQEFCDQVFAKLDELNEHLMQLHGIARFCCLVEGCDKGYSNNIQLKLHIKTDHMSESGSTCTICNKSFKSQDYVLKHIRVMHMKGVFKCTHEQCDYVATLRRELDNHYYAAHPVLKKCPFEDCGQTLNSAVYSVHLRKHYNIKNYPCSWPECGKLFADSRALKDHLRIHLGFKRYRCTWPECGYASEQRANVIKHIRIRHFKLPYTKKQELELNLPHDPNAPKPQDYMERLPDDIVI